LAKKHTRRNSRVSMQKQKNSRRRWLVLSILAMVVLLTSALAGMWFASTSLFQKVPKINLKNKQQEELLYASDKATVLIMGVDEREGNAAMGEDPDSGRSDTLMVAVLDPHTNQASLLSVPRDTRVRVKGLGWDKINAAYAYGGDTLTRSTVERFLGTPMDHYVLVNTRNFPKIIDALGGVEIDVEQRMKYEDPYDDDGGLFINLYPGLQHMDGKTAVTYVRYRDEEGDIGRIRRQQKFMAALMQRITSPGIIPRLPNIIREVMSSVKTDLSFRQIMELAGSLKNARDNGLRTAVIDGKPAEIDGVDYWIPDISDVRENVAKVLGVSMSGSFRRAMEREEAEYDASLPPQTIFTDEQENIRRGLPGYAAGGEGSRESRRNRSGAAERDGKKEKEKLAEERKDAAARTGTVPTRAQREAVEEDEEDRRENSITYVNNGGGETEQVTAPRVPSTPTAPSAPVSPRAGGKRQN